MEVMKIVEEKGSPKMDCRFSRARNQKSRRCNFLEPIAQVQGGAVNVSHQSDEEGVIRMQIVLRKQNLRHMVALIASGKTTGVLHRPSSSSSSLPSLPTASSFEQRLYVMRRRHLRRVHHLKGPRSAWRPVLQSIPE